MGLQAKRVCGRAYIHILHQVLSNFLMLSSRLNAQKGQIHNVHAVQV